MDFYHHITNDLHMDDEALRKKVELSIEVIEQALSLYSLDGVALSFNGGKDCCVLLHLLHLVLSKYSSLNRLKIVYFLHENTFPEVDIFVKKCSEFYGVNIDFLPAPIISSLTEYVKSRNTKAIFMGTRSTDPRASNLREFTRSDTQHGWPDVMRCNPILFWNYEDIWKFIRAMNVPYCELYDKGYTSIGCTTDTIPNPALETNKGYDPAYKLLDGSKERAGRLSG